jgi:2-keto-4-pentenoate hydratase/2-oxohepta-3-ene-1,7-dioic acid hydratase in catechol pathway
VRRSILHPLAVLAALTSACGFAWEPAFDVKVEPSVFEAVAIADPDDALTFARVGAGDARRVLAVARYRAGSVEGVDLTALLGRRVDDPIRVFLEVGYETLRAAVSQPAPGARVSVRAEDLVIPVDLRDHHIAAGLNFAAHAGEASVEHGPFLFPKLVSPTGPRSPVSVGAALLDYEAELAWVPLEPLSEHTTPDFMGLVLCNDYTDRAALLRGVDVGDVASGKGFTAGKSAPGYLPVGNLFVVPRDFRAFAGDLELRLYVNQGLRQRSVASHMIWDIDEILAQTWARQSLRWDHRGEEVSLLEKPGLLPDRTLLMSGTPHGTVFQGVGTRQKLSGLLAWLLGGWGESIPSHAVSAYIDDARSARVYLQPGDRVAIHVDYLGAIRNGVTP